MSLDCLWSGSFGAGFREETFQFGIWAEILGWKFCIIIFVHVCILFPNLVTLQMTGLWTEGSSSSSPPDFSLICVVFILFLKMVAFLGMLKEAPKVIRAVKYVQANMNMLGPIFSKLSLHA